MTIEKGGGEPRDMIADMLVDMVEKSGYRQLGGLKEDLHGGIDAADGDGQAGLTS